MPIHPRQPTVALCLIVASLAAPLANAQGSQLRLLVPHVDSFASDGARYAAWQVYQGSPIVVLDTFTGRRREFRRRRCRLANEETFGAEARQVAASGRFLLECPIGFPDVLSARTGASFELPILSSYSPWEHLGSRYAEGFSAEQKCVLSAAERKIYEGGCRTLFDLTTGALRYRPQLQFANLDRRGAPAECPAVRRRAFALEAKGASDLAYRDGLLAFPSRKPEGGVELVRCSGRPLLLPGSGFPKSFVLGAGVLTWDDGRDITEGDPEEARPPPELLYSYDLTNGARRAWQLPAPSVAGTEFQGYAYGYSSHTANMVFWIAQRELVNEDHGSSARGYSVYAAPA